MPTRVWLYLTAWLDDRTSARCVALAEALETVSHDRLTRRLQADWSGPTLRELAVRTLLVRERGDLLRDDTVISKPLATALERLTWVYASQERKPVSGVALGLLGWTNGTCRVPWGGRLWRKGGPSKDALALELLSYARKRLRCRPDDVLFDAWSPSKALLTRLRDDGGSLVCRLQKPRRCNGPPLRTVRRHPSWAERGWRTGGVTVVVVSYGAQDSTTNRLTRTAVERRRPYRMRAQMAEVIRACTDQLGLGGCQARSARAPLPHITCGLVAFCGLERDCPDQGLSIYKLKRHLSFRGRSVALPALERLRSTA